MAKKVHGNSRQNQEEHHLYEIIDSVDNDVVKYGISAEEISEDGYSSRMRLQINFVNSFVGWMRFFGRILVKGIKGRIKAEQIEQEHIKEYEEKNGQKPRGNKR
ncbi:MAG: hypothetical protein AAGG68_24615 [Bacteroidota bacterium]